MTAKRILLFFFLLLTGGSSFAFTALPVQLGEQEKVFLDLEFEEEVIELYEATIPFVKIPLFKGHPDLSTGSFRCQDLHQTQLENNYIKRSEMIIPGLDVPEIIFPFHVFL